MKIEDLLRIPDIHSETEIMVVSGKNSFEPDEIIHPNPIQDFCVTTMKREDTGEIVKAILLIL